MMSDDLNIFSEGEVGDALNEEEDESTNVNSTEAGKRLKKKKKKAYVYKDKDDVNILKEVMLEKPGKKNSAKKWKIIYDRLKLPVHDYRSLRCRFELLMKSFKEDNLKSLKGSGTEEDFNEKAQLLTEIDSEIKDWDLEEATTASKVKRKTEEDHRRAQTIRNAAANTVKVSSDADQEGDDETTPKRFKRHKPSDYMEFIKLSEDRNYELQLRNSEMDKKKIEIMEREMKVKEDSETHRRDMEKRQMALEEERLKCERDRLQKEQEEKSLLIKFINKAIKD